MKKFDFRMAYFALVALVSVLAFGFSFASLLQNLVLLAWPELLQADIDAARQAAEEMMAYKEDMSGLYLPTPPQNREMVGSIVYAVVFAIIAAFHLPPVIRKSLDER